MKIVTWNINGIRTFKSGIKQTLDSFDADIICVQETKVTSKCASLQEAAVSGTRDTKRLHNNNNKCINDNKAYCVALKCAANVFILLKLITLRNKAQTQSSCCEWSLYLQRKYERQN